MAVYVWKRERGWVCVCAREGMNTRPNIVGVAASQSRHATFFFLSVFSTSSLFFPSTLSHHTQQRTAREWVSECVCMCMNGCAWASVRERERERARDRIRCTALAHKKSCCLFCCCRCCSSLTLFIESFFAGKLWNRLEKLTRRVPPKNRNLFTGKMFRQGQKNIGQRTTEKCVDVFDAKRAGKKV